MTELPNTVPMLNRLSISIQDFEQVADFSDVLTKNDANLDLAVETKYLLTLRISC